MLSEPPERVEFGDWLPDLPPNENPGAILVKNAIPRAKSYRDFPSLSAFSDALDGVCLGSFWARSSGGNVFNFAGDQTKLYSLTSGTSWSDVSQAATTYSASFWDWVQVNNRVIATDGGANDLQYFDMDTSSEFADLPGTPPRFKTLAQVRDFVVGGNWSLGSDVEPGGIAWSGFNNTEIWTPSLAFQSNRVPGRGSRGQVQRIVPGERGIAICENSIATIDYIGPPVVFDLSDPIVNHGTQAPRAVAWTRQWVFYYSQEGFMKMDRSTLQVTPIGAGRFNNWFADEAAADDIANIVAAVDRRRGLVFWAFRSSSSATNYNRILVYNWVFDRAAYAVIETQFIGEFSSVGANLDTLDSVLGGDIDSASIPVDTDAYIGGALSLLGFNADNEACTFSGTPLIAELDTQEFGVGGRHSLINEARPIVDGSPSLVEVAPVSRDLITANPAVGSYLALNGIGAADIRQNARYHRMRTRITGGFDHAQRMEIRIKKRGRR